MDLRRVARLFESVGAKCRKLRGRSVYECWRGDVKAIITPRGMEALGARSAYLDFPGLARADIVIEFDPVMADRAASVFMRASEYEMWPTVTNVRGELRLYKKHSEVGPREWIDTLT